MSKSYLADDALSMRVSHPLLFYPTAPFLSLQVRAVELADKGLFSLDDLYDSESDISDDE